MKYSPKHISFFQAVGLTAYIVVIANVINRLEPFLKLKGASPAFNGVTFLLVFVISALISGAIMLGYPYMLFSSGKQGEAIRVLARSILWLVLFLVLLIFFVFAM